MGIMVTDGGPVINPLDMEAKQDRKGIFGRLPASRLKMSAMG